MNLTHAFRPLAWTMLLLLLVACSLGQQSGDDSTEPQPTAGGTPFATAEAWENPLEGEASTTVAPRAGVSPITQMPSGTNGYPWWNDTVWYEVFVRSFYDSNGDGIGDLPGLIEKLDYLNDGDPTTTNDLGITGIWLMPIFPSPSYHGYDVTDYYDINPEYGTKEDFKRLMDEAHKRGIRVIIDYVINHTSSQHPWFQAALAGDPQYVDWYRFVEGEQPTQFAPWGGGNVWHPAGDDRYYYGLYWSEMPDLNYENTAVTEEIGNITRFWLEEMGVDGFRVDGAAHIVEEGRAVKNTPQTIEWLKGLRAFMKSINPESVLVGEVWYGTDEVAPYIEGEALDLAFEFTMANNLVEAAKNGTAGPLQVAYGLAAHYYPSLQYAPFITNHDIDRLFSTVGRSEEKAKMAGSVLLTGPGSPFLYYGEEIAMSGSKPDEDIRLPFPWTGASNGGFTTGTPWRGFPADYEQYNVATLSVPPDSILNRYRALIQLRNQNEALRVGEYAKVESDVQPLFAFLRYSKNQTVLVLHNMGAEPITDYALYFDGGIDLGNAQAVELLWGAEVSAPQIDADHAFNAYRPLDVIEPYRSYVIQLRP
ncbi:MAG: alpha-amylase [Ardenticatenales bacterium]|nr:alpha-amylase [Ardenticatenales bacterium]